MVVTEALLAVLPWSCTNSRACRLLAVEPDISMGV